MLTFPANSNQPVQAFDAFDDRIYSVMAEYSEHQCNFAPLRGVVSSVAKAKTWLPGSILRLRDGTFGYIALHSAVQKPTDSAEVVVLVSKWGIQGSVKHTVAHFRSVVEAVIPGVLSTEGGPNAAAPKFGQAAAAVNFQGARHYISPGPMADGQPTVTVIGNGMSEQLEVESAVQRYELRWRTWQMQPPGMLPQDTERPDGLSLWQVDDWVLADVLRVLKDKYPDDKDNRGAMAQHIQDASDGPLFEGAAKRLHDMLAFFRLEARGSTDGVTLATLASFICALAGMSQDWIDDTIVLLNFAHPTSLLPVDQLVALAEDIASTSGQLIEGSYGAVTGTLINADLAFRAGGMLRDAVRADGEPPPGGQQRTQTPNLGLRCQPQQDFTTPAPTTARPTEQQMVLGLARDGALGVQVSDVPAMDASRQFAPARAANPHSDVQMWVAMLGGDPIQLEIASAAGRKIRESLTPLGGVEAARISFGHLLRLFGGLVSAGAWSPDEPSPSDWEGAKARLGRLLDAADGIPNLSAAPRPAPAGLTPLLQPPPPPPPPVGLTPELVSGLAQGLANGLKDSLAPGLSRALRGNKPMENLPSVAPAPVIRDRGAATAELVRPLCAEAVIDYEAQIGSAASRGKSSIEELSRLTKTNDKALAQATRAIFQSGGTVTEKTGAMPVNVLDAVAAGRLQLRDTVRKARGGPLLRPDVMTPERVKLCDSLALGIAKGDIDLDVVVKVLGGTAPPERRPLAGESLCYGSDGDPSDRNDIRSALEELVILLKTWWGEVMGIYSGAKHDFGITSTYVANRNLQLPALKQLLASGFAYTHECFMQDREAPKDLPPAVTAAWSLACKCDAEPLLEDQRIAAAAEAHTAKAATVLDGKMKSMAAEHKKEMDALRSKLNSRFGEVHVVPGGEPAAKRKATQPVDPDATGTPKDSKKPKDTKGADALPLPASALNGEGGVFGDLGKTLKAACPVGDWPCLSKLLQGTCTRDNCRSCATGRQGNGDPEVCKVVRARLELLQQNKLLSGPALVLTQSALRRRA